MRGQGRRRLSFGGLGRGEQVLTGAARSSVETVLPVSGHRAGGPGDGLIERMTFGRGQRGSFEELLRAIVVEPLFTRLEAPDHRMSRCPVVGARVLAGRVVAAPDM